MPPSIADADYVVAVRADAATVNKVVSALEKSQLFGIQVRQGLPDQVFVFVKASTSTVAKLLHADKVSDWLNDIPEDPSKKASQADKLRVIYQAIADLKIAEIDGVKSIFPISDRKKSSDLVKKVTSQSSLTDSDLNTLQDTYGSKVAMYFAFVQYYFQWSLIPAVVGASTQYLLGSYSWLFTISNLVWAACFIAGWSRRQQQLSIQWGDKNVSNDPGQILPSFKGSTAEDPITGQKTPFSPAWQRVLKELSFLPVAATACLILILFQAGVFTTEIFFAQIYDGPGKSVLGLIPTFLLVGLTPFFMKFYAAVVKKTTAWENHKYDETYQESYGQKLFAFQFLIGFTGLFLTSYVYLPFGHLIVPHLSFIKSNVHTYSRRAIPIAESFTINGLRLRSQTIYMSVTAQVISLITELVVPFALRFVFGKIEDFSGKVVSYNDAPDEIAFLTEVRRQAKLPVYDTGEDYRQLVIQFGYSLLFAPVWQYAPVAAFIFNFLQLRGDLTKVVLGSRRPIPSRTESIGPWIKNLKVISWIASITAPSIVVMFGSSISSPVVDNEKFASVLPGIVTASPWLVLSTVLISEHVFFVVNAFAAAFFNALPTPEFIKFEKSKYVVRRNLVAAQVPEINISNLEKPESDWPITDTGLEAQIKTALIKPKTLKDKKNE